MPLVASILQPTWLHFGMVLAPILDPSWLQMAQKIDSKIHQKTDAILYRFLVDFWSILAPNWTPTWGEKGLLCWLMLAFGAILEPRWPLDPPRASQDRFWTVFGQILKRFWSNFLGLGIDFWVVWWSFSDPFLACLFVGLLVDWLVGLLLHCLVDLLLCCFVLCYTVCCCFCLFCLCCVVFCCLFVFVTPFGCCLAYCIQNVQMRQCLFFNGPQ